MQSCVGTAQARRAEQCRQRRRTLSSRRGSVHHAWLSSLLLMTLFAHADTIRTTLDDDPLPDTEGTETQQHHLFFKRRVPFSIFERNGTSSSVSATVLGQNQARRATANAVDFAVTDVKLPESRAEDTSTPLRQRFLSANQTSPSTQSDPEVVAKVFPTEMDQNPAAPAGYPQGAPDAVRQDIGSEGLWTPAAPEAQKMTQRYGNPDLHVGELNMPLDVDSLERPMQAEGPRDAAERENTVAADGGWDPTAAKIPLNEDGVSKQQWVDPPSWNSHQRSLLGSRKSGVTWDEVYKHPPDFFHLLEALGGGTGAAIRGTGIRELDRDLMRRLHFQDQAVLVLLVVAYFVSISLIASMTYRQSHNNSQVTYYADPRFHAMVMEGHTVEAFMDAFNDAPKSVQLQVTGFVPIPEGVMATGVQWQGELYHVAFTFALDLSPWVVWEREIGQLDDSDPNRVHSPLEDGIESDGIECIRGFLENSTNDLATLELVKEVSWPHWEELATNIKHRIRQSGFNGIIGIHRTETDTVCIYKNRPWANYIHNRMTKVLCLLSVFGWMFYVPYTWFRCTKSVVKAHFKVDVSIANYWPLIADKLGATGFEIDSSRRS